MKHGNKTWNIITGPDNFKKNFIKSIPNIIMIKIEDKYYIELLAKQLRIKINLPQIINVIKNII